jgi:hypothetical protein
VPDDLTSLAQPQFVLVAWGAGLALASGAVALARVVGPGFTWLSGSLAALIGLSAVFGDDTWWAWFGLICLTLGLVWARNRQLSGIFQVTGGFALMAQAATIGAWIPSVSATIALGGVTSEMMLSHWYLVDPRLPRWVLKGLGSVGLAGVAADAIILAVAGLPGGGATIAFWVLTLTSLGLMAAAVAALRYPAYSGVMAATGLSYLAVLTTVAGVFLGRVLVAGVTPLT